MTKRSTLISILETQLETFTTQAACLKELLDIVRSQLRKDPNDKIQETIRRIGRQQLELDTTRSQIIRTLNDLPEEW